MNKITQMKLPKETEQKEPMRPNGKNQQNQTKINNEC